ncbi:MAG: hypothetical protein AABZ74_13720 [Cyanobacteriota bacterium]
MTSDLLVKIQKHKDGSNVGLEKWLCSKILESNQEPSVYLNEIISSGGKTGGIGQLLYYKDIYTFFESNYDEIQYLIINFQKNGGKLELQEDIKSELTWLALQIIAFQIAVSVGLKT